MRDLENLVPVVESALEYASRAIEAKGTFLSLVHIAKIRRKDEFDRFDQQQNEQNEQPNQQTQKNSLVELGELKEETWLTLREMGEKLGRYMASFDWFVNETLDSDYNRYRRSERHGSDSESEGESYFGTHDEHVDRGNLCDKINEKLESAHQSLGRCLSQVQVAGAYKKEENESDANEREKATRLARFLCDCYFNRLRGKVVSFLEKTTSASITEINLALVTKQLSQEHAEARVQQTKKVTKDQLERLDDSFRATGSTVRAMEIKTRINELESRLTKSAYGVQSVEELEALVGRVTKAQEALVRIAEGEVRPFLSGLVDQLNRTPEYLRTRRIHKIGHLIPVFQSYMSHVSEFMYSAAEKAMKTLKKAKEAKEAAEAARAEEERSAESSGESESEDRMINENRKKLDTVVSDLGVLSDKLYLASSRSTSVFGSSSSSSSSSSAFGRYVRRAAKHSVRVAPRAWGA